MKRPVLKKIMGVLLCGCKYLGLFPLSASYTTEGIALSAVSRESTEFVQRGKVPSIELATILAEGRDCNGKVWLAGFT